MSYTDVEPDERDPVKRQIDELLREARKADREDLEKADALQALIRHPAWATYMALLGTRIQHFADTLLAPGGSIDGLVAQEYLKGAMSGLIIARDIPQVIIAATAEIRKPATEGTEQ